MTLRNPRTLLGVRNLIPLCLLALITAPITALIPAAHGQEQLWIRQFGTQSADFAEALAPDGAGGAFVAGWTEGSLGGANAGAEDVFLTRFDDAGNLLWLRQFGTSELDQALALASDGAGGVFVGGRTAGSLGGPIMGDFDAFLARYNGAGKRLWIRQFGTSGYDGVGALAPDGTGGVLVAGGTTGSLGGANAGGSDVFLARYDSEGNQLSIHQFGSSDSESAQALAPDGAGGVMVGGRTTGGLGGPFAGFIGDAFVARDDGAGHQLWIHQFGTCSWDNVWALAPDGAGGVMVAGMIGLNNPCPDPGELDGFLARYDHAGNRLWFHRIGSWPLDIALALATDGAGGVLVAGGTESWLGGPRAGRLDVFLARYDGEGSQIWITQFGTSTNDLAYALASDGAGGVMIAGSTYGSLGGPNAGDGDVFLARYTTGVCPCACGFDTSTGSGVCDFLDFAIFGGLFVAGDPCACDIDTSTGQGVCDLVDFTTFAGQFAAGCP